MFLLVSFSCTMDTLSTFLGDKRRDLSLNVFFHLKTKKILFIERKEI
jgi:hypothetical protein